MNGLSLSACNCYYKLNRKVPVHSSFQNKPQRKRTGGVTIKSQALSMCSSHRLPQRQQVLCQSKLRVSEGLYFIAHDAFVHTVFHLTQAAIFLGLVLLSWPVILCMCVCVWICDYIYYFLACYSHPQTPDFMETRYLHLFHSLRLTQGLMQCLAHNKFSLNVFIELMNGGLNRKKNRRMNE